MAERYTGRTLRELLRVVASRWLGVLLIVVVVCVAVGVATFFQPRVYRHEVMMSARPNSVGSPMELQAGAREEVVMFVRAQRDIILSNHVLTSAVMQLHDVPADLPPLAIGKRQLPVYSEKKVTDWAGQNPEKVQQIDKAVKILTSGGAEATTTFTVQVDWPEQRGAKIPVGMTSRELAAEQASQLAKIVIDAYQVRRQMLQVSRANQAAAFFEQSLAEAQKKRTQAGTNLQNFINEQLKADMAMVNQLQARGVPGEVGLQELVTRNQGEIKDIHAQMSELAESQSLLLQELTPFVPAADLAAELQRPGVDAQAAAAAVTAAKEARDARGGKAKDPYDDMVVPEVVLKSNEAVKAYQEHIVDLKIRLSDLRSRYTEQHQGLIDARQQLKTTHEDLLLALKQEVRRLNHELARLQAKQTSLEGIVQADRDELQRLAKLTAEYESLRRDLDTAEKLYEEETRRLSDAKTAAMLAQTPVLVGVMDPGNPADADRPYSPNVLLNMLAALLTGIVLALIYAFVADHFDHTIKSVDEAERYLGVPVLASVPKLGRKIIQTR